MAHDDSVSEDEWYVHVTEAAKQLSLGNYYTYPSNRGGAQPSADATVTLKTPKSDFMRNRGGMIIVDVCQDGHYEVVVETDDGLTSIRPRKKDC